MMPMLDSDRIGKPDMYMYIKRHAHTDLFRGRLKDKQLVHGRKSAREGTYITYIAGQPWRVQSQKKWSRPYLLAPVLPQARQVSLSSDRCSPFFPPVLHILPHSLHSPNYSTQNVGDKKKKVKNLEIENKQMKKLRHMHGPSLSSLTYLPNKRKKGKNKITRKRRTSGVRLALLYLIFPFLSFLPSSQKKNQIRIKHCIPTKGNERYDKIPIITNY